MNRLLAVALVSTVASCALVMPRATTPQPEVAPAAAEPPPAFPIIHQAVAEADALVTSDPAAAEVKYLRARAALFKLWGEQRGGDMPNNRIMRAFGHVDSQTEGSEADELMWRTFLGRARALEALGRQEEILGELPDRSLEAHDCWGELASACTQYLAHLKQIFPDAIADEHDEDGRLTGRTFAIVQWRVEQPPDSLDTTKAMLELPKLKTKLAKLHGWVLIAMTASRVARGADGRITLRLVGHDLGIRTGENCKKYLKQELVDNHIVVEERCQNVSHENVRNNELVVTARAAPDLPPAKYGDVYTLAVPAGQLTGNGHSFAWSHAVVLRVDGEHGMRYWYGANLDWSLPQAMAAR